MQNTIKAKNGVTLAKSVANVPAPVTAPVATPPQPAQVTFTHPVTTAQVQAWLNANCTPAGAKVGSMALAGIVPLANAANPANGLPFLRGNNSNRAKILAAHLWGFAQGHKVGQPVPWLGVNNYCIATFKTAYGLNNYLDVCALLNGGYNPSSKTWGIPFAKLVVLPQQ